MSITQSRPILTGKNRCKTGSDWLHFLALDWLLFTLLTTYSDALLTGSPSQLCINDDY